METINTIIKLVNQKTSESSDTIYTKDEYNKFFFLKHFPLIFSNTFL